MHSYPELYKICAERFSCRSYSSEPVDRDTLMAVLDIARLAPSACNRQPWMFIIARGDDERDAVLTAYPREWIAGAPVYIIACGIHDDAWHRPTDGKDHTDVDVSIAVEHLCLAAASMHLGSCWVCNFDPVVITRAFNLPAGIEPIAIIPLGYPAEGVTPPAKNRKPLCDIVREGKF